ncbi:MAG: glycoside hydrolase family 9 protein [Cellvibrionaceae bacterium]|nr:glycoside hydrolase family 9 protein [Cellvibrionaceae bacterium]
MFRASCYSRFKIFKNVTRYCVASVVLSSSLVQAANIINNGSFDDGTAAPWEPPGWWAGGAGSSGVDDNGRFCVAVEQEGSEIWGAQLRQGGLQFAQDETYSVSFRAWSTAPVTLDVSATDENGGFVFLFGSVVNIDAPLAGDGELIELQYTASADSDNALFRFLLGAGLVPAGETLCVDDVVVDAPAVNLISNPDFSESIAPWELGFWNESAGSAVVENGRACVQVDNPGLADWSVQMRESDLRFAAGREYAFSADVWSSTALTINASGVDESDGFTYHFGENFAIDAPLDGAPQTITANFVNGGGDTEQGKFRFLLGDTLVPAGETVCFDNVELLDPEGETEDSVPLPLPIVVNQHGYLPKLQKHATYVLGSSYASPETPRSWQLFSGETKVASGQTVYSGVDVGSGDITHLINFSEVSAVGEFQFRIVEDAGLESEAVFNSETFSIDPGLYGQFKYDALAYFYHNRSGIAIEADLVGEAWARPAGHLQDASVETFACVADPNSELCRVLDVSGGWYDAGDHGKYVVNAGISVWTLMNQYERSRYLGGNLTEYGDGSMALPASEIDNGIPDILDEVRWELDWMMKMQVPAGSPNGGLVYHKMHSEFWTGIPTAPDQDPVTRYVQPPSTTATLNLAASGAQCYRVFREFDADFAQRCLQQAQLAYAAAKSNAFIPATDNGNGGGTYADSNPGDEFYWAASELFLATGADNYAVDMASASELHLSLETVAYGQSMMGWPTTHGLGIISMATVGRAFNAPESWVETSRQALIAVADLYLDKTRTQAFGLPMGSEQLYWGSNSNVANNMIVLGLARDFTCNEDYANAMQSSMSYLLGRNPLGQSYVSGYGSLSMENPHHRFWAGSVDDNFPLPPPGVLAGGPNGLLQDPIIAARLQGCTPMKCYLDHIESYSSNEVTINWNAPLAWAAAYLDELGDAPQYRVGYQRCLNRNRHFSSFEDPERKWSMGGSAAIDVVAESSDGDSGLSISGCAYMPLSSPSFNTSEFDIVGDQLAVDIKLPALQANPSWLGDAQILISFEDAGVFNAWLGIDFMDENALENWSTLRFSVSPAILEHFEKDQNATMTLALNSENCEAPMLIDNVRFSGNTKERSF